MPLINKIKQKQIYFVVLKVGYYLASIKLINVKNFENKKSLFGIKDFLVNMAQRMGFEPMVRLLVHQISSLAHSAALTSLQAVL